MPLDWLVRGIHEPAVACAGPCPDPGVAGRRRADELVERQVVGLGQREQELEARLALPGLQARQRALRDPGLGGERDQRQVPSLTQPPQPRADFGQHVRDRRRVAHGRRYRRFPETATKRAIHELPAVRVKRMEPERNDVAIVGGGPAGLSAALVLGRARRRVVVIDAGVPRNAPATHMQGFLSRDGMAPADLLSAARAEVRRYGVEVIEDRVVDATAGFALRLASGRAIEARHVLLATGAADSCPMSPAPASAGGAISCTARTATAGRCAICHSACSEPVPGPSSTPTCSANGPTTSILFTHASPVTLAERATLDARGIVVIDGAVERLVVTDDRLRAVAARRRSHRLARCALHPSCAARAPRGTRRGPRLHLAEGDLVRADADGRTSVPGVWAAGNATNPRAQVITAAGEGSAVAIAINTELVDDDVDAVVQRAAAATAA